MMSHHRINAAFVAAVLCSQVIASEPPSSTSPRGARIYAERCASCHGMNGEGTKDNYPEPLFGDQPTADLSDYIAEAMPEGEPELCDGEDARAVAEWMQTAFYSPEAQARINPPKRSLSRLTVSQYRNSVADLAAGFLGTTEPDDKRGLRARYYKTRNFREQVFERLDPSVDFHFGEATPDKEKIPNSEEFSVRWSGSIIVNETGWYDFILKTENGGRVYLNDRETPLIDAWVKSGYDTQYRGSRYLLAGRLYRVYLEWFTYKEKTASVGLWWKPPHGVEEAVPERHLSPVEAQPTIVVETPFPPDDRSDGYIRGTAVSREWDEATTLGAIEAADKLIAHANRMAGVKRGATADERRRKFEEFCRTFAYRAFRRPLTDEQRQAYVGHFFDTTTDAEDAMRRSLLAVLKSPRFLYHEVTGENDLYTKASRLSFALIDSVPHRGLLLAAEKGWLKSEKAQRDQAGRLANSYRGQIRLHEFLRVWMNLERIEDLDKDEEIFAAFSPQIAADLRTSLELLLEEAASSEDGFQRLLSTEETWMNGRLADFYGLDVDEQPDFRKVRFEPEFRAGISSHPFMLSGLAYRRTSSPIHRGVFLSRGILGRALQPPPDSVAPLAPNLAPNLTTRERVIRQTSPALCSNCHKMINSLGFALENFDAVGRYREQEKERPVDSAGHYRLRTGELATFTGARELADFLVQNNETHRSLSRQLFHHMVRQPILAFGPDTIEQLAETFVQRNMDMKELMVEIAVRSASHTDKTSGDLAESD